MASRFLESFIIVDPDPVRCTQQEPANAAWLKCTLLCRRATSTCNGNQVQHKVLELIRI
jgi:hypothetical protein